MANQTINKKPKPDCAAVPGSDHADISLFWIQRNKGELPAINTRQTAILDFWGAWLLESQGDYEQDCIVVPYLLNDLWRLSSDQNAEAVATASIEAPNA